MTDTAVKPRFLVLGPLSITGDGEAALGGPKQRAVLAMLISRVGRVVSNDQLVDGIWGEVAPGSVQSSLHTYVSNLRAVGADIQRSGGGYLLEADPGSVDAVAFERLTDEAIGSLSANPERAAESLRAGLGLWRGRPYADLTGVEGLQAEIRRLEELRFSAVEARIDADLALGRHQVVAGELVALAAEYPLRERLQAQLMVALYRDGRQTEALRAYQRTREYLRDELGVDPSPELERLELRILNHDPDLLTIRDTVTERVAFLFTDIASSTELWETRAAAMRAALSRHDEILSQAIEGAGGRLFKHTGDGVLAAFPTVVGAVEAATESQRGLGAADWGDLELEVRMAVDAGEVEVRGGDYFGPPLNRGSRLMAAAHGGQILLSEGAQQALSAEPGMQLRNLGEHRLRGLGAPVRVFQLVTPDLPAEFPGLRLDAAASGPARQFGDVIRGYEVRERLCARRVSVVYRAFQPTVGREVAVKVIRPEFANHPSFVRRFESEARMVAGLEHPHIVSLYDYWRDADGAYLVMPLMAGGSLADKTLGALPLQRVAALVSQVGSALGYAHRQGVIHRDVKPSNILLDGDGNAYLADFGIAVRAVEAQAGIQSASAVYRAPEDRAGAAVDERSDVYSLARVVAGLLTGSEEPDLSGLDPPLRGLLEGALSEDPAQRPESVDSLVGRLNALSGGRAAAPRPVVSRNPYKGLRPFETDDARDFFGRDQETHRLVELVAGNRLVVVVGPSGSGKSSLVRAGLVPALRRGALAGSERWVTVTTVPGSHPFDELASRLGEVATEAMGDMVAELAADERGLLRVSKRIMSSLEGELVLVVDQFEELYTAVTAEEVRRLFIRNLVEATEDSRSRVRVVLTLRADFYDHPLGDELLGPIVSETSLALAVPTPPQLREAIERPAAGAGVVFEQGLTDQLLTDVQGQPGSLPLLQFALEAMVAGSADGKVTAAEYERLGGVGGALTRRAEVVYRSLGDGQLPVAEEIFMRLVTVTEDTDDVRRRVRQSELESLGLDPGDVAEVLTRYGDARLLTFDRDPLTRGPTVEVAHEAMLRSWERLRHWLDNRREALILHRRFRAAHTEWADSGEEAAYLLTGGRLTQFETWASRPEVTLTPEEARYLTHSVAARDAADTRRRRIRRGILAGFAAAAVIALALATTALIQRQQATESAQQATQSATEAGEATEQAEQAAAQAEQSAEVARARELVAEAENVLGSEPELSIHLALAAIEPLREAGEDTSQAVSAMRAAIANDRVTFRAAGGEVVAVHPDGGLLATTDVEDGEAVGVAVWDVDTAQIVERLATGNPTDLKFAPDGESLFIAFGGADQPVRRWDLTTGQTTLFGPTETDTACCLALSPDGELIVFETWNTEDEEDPTGNEVQVWSLDDGTLVYQTPGWGPDLSADGLLSYSTAEAGGNQIVVVDPVSGETLQSIPTDFFTSRTSWSPDGSRVAAASQTDLAIYEVEEGIEVVRPILDRINDPEWLPAGDAIVVGGESTTRVVDAATGEIRMELLGQSGGTFQIEPVPGTDQFASAGFVDAVGVVIFDASPLGGVEVGGWTSPISIGFNAAYDHDGGRVLIAEGGAALQDGTQDGWYAIADAIDGTGAQVVEGEGVLWFPNLDPTGNFVAYAMPGGSWVVRSLESNEIEYRAPDGWSIRAVSDDGSKVVIHHPIPSGPEVGNWFSGQVRLVDTRDGNGVDLAVEPTALSWFSTDGEVVVVSSVSNTPELGTAFFDTASGELLAHLGGTPYGGFAGAFTPDGTKAVIGDYDGDLIVFDVEMLLSGADVEDAVDLEIHAHQTLILKLVVSPDGTMAATAAWDEPLKLWDIEAGQLLGEFGSGSLDGPHLGDFHPTEPHLLVTTPPDQVRTHTLDIDELIAIAQSKPSREMTEPECQLYFREPCPTGSLDD